MPPPIYFRILGHVATLMMHSINSLAMLSSLQDEIIMKDPEIKNLASMQSRFLTVWNIAFQLAYSLLALTCDVLTLTNREHLLPKSIKKFRDFFFSSVVFPGTMLVIAVFWPLYLYDRSLIFPEYIDKVFSQKSNHIIHAGIVPVVMWELAFQPRDKPKSHGPYLAVITLYYLVYNAFIFYTYQQRGIWPYPLLHIVHGTIFNVIVHILAFCLFIIGYFMQWSLYTLFWRKENRSWEKIKLK